MSEECIIAIDPGSKSTGVAWFIGGKLVRLETYAAEGERASRTQQIVADILKGLDAVPTYIVMEDPLLQGKSNNSMQRFIGALEYALLEHYFLKQIEYIHPMSVKKAMGYGGKDKQEVAAAAKDMLKTAEEKKLVSKAIKSNAFDATDAVAIGLTYFIHKEKEGA